MNKFIILTTILILIVFNVFSQELKCNVTVNTQLTSSTDPAVFKTLEQTINKFMNDRKWTDDTFSEREKINCDLSVTITEDNGNGFYNANAMIQITRPVYNADYKTPLFTFNDQNWDFGYQQFEDLNYNEASYTKELPVMLAYYAYLIIGSYYDSFSPMGGDPYFLKAQNIVNIAQNESGSGAWKPSSSNYNRFMYIENTLNKNLKGMREISYNYHRKGLDMMHADIVAGRNEIMNSINTLDKVKQDNPGISIMVMQTFFDTKSKELVDIMSGANTNQKQDAYNKLSQLNPVKGSFYQQILKGK